jgi:chorismate dehydratase
MPQLVRVGAVSYLNTKPLIYDLERFAPHAELSLAVPSRLADQLAGGELDVALIPSIEYFRGTGYAIVPDVAIAAYGPVRSVNLYCRVPPEQVRTLALDEGSRTSAALTWIWLRRRYGVSPESRPLPLGVPPEECDADAVLAIGDRAIRSGSLGRVAPCTFDLGEEWLRLTGLPFVFAMWVTRIGVDLHGVDRALRRAKREGLRNLRAIAEREAPRHGITTADCVSYFTEALRFDFGPRELEGLNLFYRWAASEGLAPPGVPIAFYDSKHPAQVP